MSKRFRLQSVLEYREQREQEQRGIAALARNAEAAAERQLTTTQTHLQAEQAAGLRLTHGLVDVDGAELGQAYREALERRLSDQAAALAVERSNRDAAEAELLERRRDRRGLEKLQERHAAAQAEAERRQEAMVIDDLTMGRAARRLACERSEG